MNQEHREIQTTIEINANDRIRAILFDIAKDRTYLENLLLGLSKGRLSNIIAAASATKKKKYAKGGKKENLYGDLPRGFTPEQLRRFILNLRTMKLRRIFLIQFFYALRIGELNNIEPIPEQGILKIYNQKCSRWDHVPIHGRTKELFNDLDSIGRPKSARLQAVFRNTLKRIGLNYSYHETSQGAHLSQFTPHSLRHTGITTFNEYINNPIRTMKFSRHRSGSREYGCLGTYISYRQEQLKIDLEAAFKPYYDLIDYAFMPVDTRRMKDNNLPKYGRVHKPK